MDYLGNIGEIAKVSSGFLVGFGIWAMRAWAYGKLMAKGKEYINKNERNTAIWRHYQSQALGAGHAAQSVHDCGEEKCRVFSGRTQLV